MYCTDFCRVVQKEIEYTVMVKSIEYEKKVTTLQIPRVYKEVYTETQEVDVLVPEQGTESSQEWTGK